MSTPNFDKIAQFTAELLLPICEIILPVSIWPIDHYGYVTQRHVV